MIEGCDCLSLLGDGLQRNNECIHYFLSVVSQFSIPLRGNEPAMCYIAVLSNHIQAPPYLSLRPLCRCGEFFLSVLKEAARVQDVVGIKDPFYAPHDLDGTLTKFHIHKPIFCDANTVFS
jgi:hypothetical protein